MLLFITGRGSLLNLRIVPAVGKLSTTRSPTRSRRSRRTDLGHASDLDPEPCIRASPWAQAVQLKQQTQRCGDLLLGLVCSMFLCWFCEPSRNCWRTCARCIAARRPEERLEKQIRQAFWFQNIRANTAVPHASPDVLLGRRSTSRCDPSSSREAQFRVLDLRVASEIRRVLLGQRLETTVVPQVTGPKEPSGRSHVSVCLVFVHPHSQGLSVQKVTGLLAQFDARANGVCF